MPARPTRTVRNPPVPGITSPHSGSEATIHAIASRSASVKSFSASFRYEGDSTTPCIFSLYSNGHLSSRIKRVSLTLPETHNKLHPPSALPPSPPSAPQAPHSPAAREYPRAAPRYRQSSRAPENPYPPPKHQSNPIPGSQAPAHPPADFHESSSKPAAPCPST